MDLNGWDASHTIPHGSYMGRREFLNKYQVSKTVSRDFLHPIFFINQFILVPLEMSMGRFIFFLLFHRVNALLKRLPGPYFRNWRVATPQYFGHQGIQRAGESLFFYLDLDIGPPF